MAIIINAWSAQHIIKNYEPQTSVKGIETKNVAKMNNSKITPTPTPLRPSDFAKATTDKSGFAGQAPTNTTKSKNEITQTPSNSNQSNGSTSSPQANNSSGQTSSGQTTTNDSTQAIPTSQPQPTPTTVAQQNTNPTPTPQTTIVQSNSAAIPVNGNIPTTNQVPSGAGGTWTGNIISGNGTGNSVGNGNSATVTGVGSSSSSGVQPQAGGDVSVQTGTAN